MFRNFSMDWCLEDEAFLVSESLMAQWEVSVSVTQPAASSHSGRSLLSSSLSLAALCSCQETGHSAVGLRGRGTHRPHLRSTPGTGSVFPIPVLECLYPVRAVLTQPSLDCESECCKGGLVCRDWGSPSFKGLHEVH